ncbi:hypothetical protein [Corynebacterium macginleyi]|uniref:Uncharacterized protein n=1 Tax=Corynebacterium macginleyi TaxID=38290 RepID=A0ABS1Y7Y7_9CORY|nr:hypothetical protein [Corynebacterium macginleyi]MBK4143164.1 hypothetical protein [Corynebacterium macginleyi]MBK4150547.1 hypothetical protein [Corynebacterium macginleyi]MBK4153264.1 hypothetical protein [Corynebacterium macginleyi]MBK4156239.1 hypothetical protein [Corynebacterium macginleyi]MBK4161007.1 hypothetical protein [Corynebacterium macginleyi]
MTATTIIVSYVPRVWAECLSCYNNKEQKEKQQQIRLIASGARLSE